MISSFPALTSSVNATAASFIPLFLILYYTIRNYTNYKILYSIHYTLYTPNTKHYPP